MRPWTSQTLSVPALSLTYFPSTASVSGSPPREPAKKASSAAASLDGETLCMTVSKVFREGATQSLRFFLQRGKPSSSFWACVRPCAKRTISDTVVLPHIWARTTAASTAAWLTLLLLRRPSPRPMRAPKSDSTAPSPKGSIREGARAGASFSGRTVAVSDCLPSLRSHAAHSTFGLPLGT